MGGNAPFEAPWLVEAPPTSVVRLECFTRNLASTVLLLDPPNRHEAFLFKFCTVLSTLS